MTRKTIFISADHGLSIVYFLQTDILPALLKSSSRSSNDVRVVILTDDALKDHIQQLAISPSPSSPPLPSAGEGPGVRVSSPLIVEGLRLKQARHYFEHTHHSLQHWTHFLRWMGGSNRINTTAMDGHMRQMEVEASPPGKQILPLIKAITSVLRRSALARKGLLNFQRTFTPALYSDLFEKYQPDLVIASTPGWRYDRYLLREAARRGVRTAAVIVGWDNPSSYRLPGAPVQDITCWSEIQKRELVLGSDWDPQRVHVGGIPSYDGYFRKTWLMPRDQYFALHGLDPNRKLLSYACSFVTFSPNYQNIEALARLVNTPSSGIPIPAPLPRQREKGPGDEGLQLLIRLHPNHFIPGSLYEAEAARIRQLVRQYPHVHLVEPVPLGGELGYYSGEDMPEKASMMAHSDVFLTVYSTMVVETALHDRPIVSMCIDAPGGWNTPGKFSLSLSEIGQWPTHQRFRASGAGRVVMNETELREAVHAYLQDPTLDSPQRSKFIRDECTFTDGEAAHRTAEWILRLL